MRGRRRGPAGCRRSWLRRRAVERSRRPVQKPTYPPSSRGRGRGSTVNMTEFEAEMDALQARVVGHDYSPVLEECHTAIIDGINRAFANQVGPDGSGWAPRKDSNPA